MALLTKINSLYIRPHGGGAFLVAGPRHSPILMTSCLGREAPRHPREEGVVQGTVMTSYVAGSTNQRS